MRNRPYKQAASALERVLVVAADAAASAPLCLELWRRGASVSAMSEIGEATTAVRQQHFDSILVMAREDANAAALFLQVLKSEALGSPRVLLLIDPQTASSYGQAIFAADEMLASTLPAARIADVTGIGAEHEAPKAAQLPAVFGEPEINVLTPPASLSRDLPPQGAAGIDAGASVRDRLRRFVAAHAERQTPCAALMITIDPGHKARRAIGGRRFHEALALYAAILPNVFGRHVEIIEAATTFLVMIGAGNADKIDARLPEVRRELEQRLAVDLHARYRIFGPEEILALL
ncbi:MAG: hypothetical protein IOC90_09765 [Methylocystis sp.]|nr:hypothetical protein [Methylocystis sp.]MCA3584272.1 hypothetical protein [Methylocystis sp.]MCA3588304.1 hypothetical protein [Methylocystis sp.]MCA3590943.1 hypothetical protein [Methylocystis sp.]